MNDTLRVGIVGINTGGSWAGEAHVPAVQHTDGLELAAVATRRQESADVVAEHFNVSKAYGDASALIHDADIDIVAVTSAVPTHHDLILEALDAGKHVLTEWPVAVGTAATTSIAAAATRSGVRTAVDLQARANPAAMRARDLVATGAVGRIQVVRVFSSTAAFGRLIDPSGVVLEDPSSGMNLTTIQTAHTLDFASMLGGPLCFLAALGTVRFPLVSVEGDNRTLKRILADHVLIQGRLAGGGALVVEVEGGRPPGDTPFRLEIQGSEGVITLTGGAPRGFQSGILSLSLNGEAVTVAVADIAASAVNVMGVYAALRDDIYNDTATAPTFDDAVRLSHLIEDVQRADAAATVVTPSAPWPGDLVANADRAGQLVDGHPVDPR